MANQNRPVTRVTFSLDNTRLLLLIGGAFVVIVAVFVVGVMVGARLGETGEAPGMLPPLAELDDSETRLEKTRDLLDQVKADEAEADSAVLDEDEPPIVAVAPKAADDSGSAETPKADPPKEAEPTLADRVAKLKGSMPKDKADPPKAEPDPPKAKSADAKTDDPPKPPKKDDPAPPKAEAKADPAPDPPKGQTAAPQGKHYAIQILATASQASADQWIKDFKAFDSHKPYIVVADIEGKGRWYRVKIGKFPTREQAEAYQMRFESNTGIKSTMLTLD